MRLQLYQVLIPLDLNHIALLKHAEAKALFKSFLFLVIFRQYKFTLRTLFKFFSESYQGWSHNLPLKS
jgi:hypothetical protein